MMLGIVDTIDGWFKPVKDWVASNGNNWLFWVGIFAAALFIFGVVFTALNKNK